MEGEFGLRAQDDRLTVWLAWIAILGLAYLAAAIGALHLLRTESDPISRYMSDYGVGEYGYLINIGFFVLAAAILALTVGLLRGVTPKPTIACALLASVGVATFVMGIFPVDESQATTTSGNIHQLGHAIQIRAIAAAAVLLAWNYGRDERWHSFQRLAISLAVAVVLALGVHTTVNQIWPELKGISQRIMAVTDMSWLLLTANHLRAVTSTRAGVKTPTTPLTAATSAPQQPPPSAA